MTQEKIEQEFRNWLLDFSTTYITDPYMARQAYLAGRKANREKIEHVIALLDPMIVSEKNWTLALNILKGLIND